ncbi:hypothetical protein, partial [Faecalibaculum rodentium]|uniref:hypothetical protein n=1 Tax=Faecalibaculum rodentium TaxID=1702221 RepID=UPI00256F5678
GIRPFLDLRNYKGVTAPFYFFVCEPQRTGTSAVSPLTIMTKKLRISWKAWTQLKTHKMSWRNNMKKTGYMHSLSFDGWQDD